MDWEVQSLALGCDSVPAVGRGGFAGGFVGRGCAEETFSCLKIVLLGWLRLLSPAKRREPVNEGKALSYVEILNWLHMDHVRCCALPEGDGMRSDVGLMKEARH